MKMTQQFTRGILRQPNLVAAFVLVFSVASMASMLLPGMASAGQVTMRSIKMSDSAASTVNTAVNGSDVGTGVNVTYRIKFNASTTANIEGIVISFCDNTPFIGDTDGCTGITGFSVGASPTVTNVSGLSAGTWTAGRNNGGGSGAANHVFTYRHTAGSSTSTNAGDTVEFEVGGFTNPSTTNHPFYARIVTFATEGAATSYTDLTPGTYLDYGGIALSTANIISITARVQESLIFCVSAVAPTANCTGTTVPSLILGHGTTNTLDSSRIDYGTAYSQISTNAISGAVIRMRNSNVCSGLSRLVITDQTTTTGCDIPAINRMSGGTPLTAAPLTAGTAAFGVNVQDGVILLDAQNAPIGSGAVTASDTYNSTVTATDKTAVGMFTGNGTTTGVSSTYGDSVASSSGPVNNINNEYTFAATASNVTPAGIYKANMALIATGTY